MLCKRTVLYRAMRDEERSATLRSGRASYIHGAKFFSANLKWIVTRVCDGSFRGSEARPGDYRRILEFSFPEVDLSLFRRLNANEWSLSKRDSEFFYPSIRDLTEAELACARRAMKT